MHITLCLYSLLCNQPTDHKETQCTYEPLFHGSEVVGLSRFTLDAARSHLHSSSDSSKKGAMCVHCEETGHLSAFCPSKDKSISPSKDTQIVRDASARTMISRLLPSLKSKREEQLHEDYMFLNKPFRNLGERDVSYERPQEAKEAGDEVPDIYCYNCNLKGHLSKNCPHKDSIVKVRKIKDVHITRDDDEDSVARKLSQVKNSIQKLAAEKACFKCHERGHLAKDVSTYYPFVIFG
jgi:hypothetical protein